MKKNILLILCVLPYLSFSQLIFDTKGVINKKISKTLVEGTNVELKNIIVDPNNNSYLVNLKYNNTTESIKIDQLDNIEFTFLESREFWKIQALKNSVYTNLIKYGLQYNLRKEIEDETLEYLNHVKRSNLLFEDNYLESYLYTLIYKIYPDHLKDERPGILNIKIIKNIEPNAYIFPNGTLFVTTGLLSTINSEDELIAVLAHEIAHFVLDHSIININKAAQRQKRAEFWAVFATGMAAITDIYLASNNSYYSPGSLTINTSILAFGIAEAINQRMGLKFSREQELDADKCAVELMKYIKKDPTSLSSALKKIETYCLINGNYFALSGEGSHPSINQRINLIGKPSIINDPKYDKIISFVNSFNALMEFNNQHFTICSNLVNRNIKADVATEEDFTLLSMVTLNLSNSDEQNSLALDYLKKAKSLNIYPTINVFKQEAIALLRLGRNPEAKISLITYDELLTKEKQKLEFVKNSDTWSSSFFYINKESEWALKMINKINKF